MLPFSDSLDLLLHVLVVALLLELLLQPHDGPRGVLRLLPQLVDLQLGLLADLGQRRVQVRHLLVQAARLRLLQKRAGLDPHATTL